MTNALKRLKKNKLEMEESHKYKELDHNNDVLLPNLKKKQTWEHSMLIWYWNNSVSHQRQDVVVGACIEHRLFKRKVIFMRLEEK